MADVVLSAEQVASFQRDGFLFVPGLFNRQEMELVHKIALAAAAPGKTMDMPDATGRSSKLWLSKELHDDVYTAMVHCQRVAGSMAQLLGGPVCHFHHKMMLKEPRVGGAWEWHQDYGYWYGNGFVWPDMASCMIAVDRATKANGCLQVLRGSNRIGRIDHGRSGQQAGADLERVEKIKEQLELVYCEMEPGTACFFHGNTLHCSAPNTSEHSRWSFITCYTKATNLPYKEKPFGLTTPAENWPNERVMEAGLRQWSSVQAAPAAV